MDEIILLEYNWNGAKCRIRAPKGCYYDNGNEDIKYVTGGTTIYNTAVLIVANTLYITLFSDESQTVYRDNFENNNWVVGSNSAFTTASGGYYGKTLQGSSPQIYMWAEHGYGSNISVLTNNVKVFTDVNEYYNYITNTFIDIQWNSVTAIVGIKGKISLPNIYGPSDGTPVYNGLRDDFITLPDSARLDNLYPGIVYGEERDILWSGDKNTMTVTWTDSTHFIIKLYDQGSYAGVGFNLWDEVTEQGSLTSNGTETPSTTEIRGKNYIPAIPNMEYKVTKLNSNSSQIVTYFYNSSKVMIPYTGRGSYANGANPSDGLFTSPAGTAYMRLRFASSYGTTYNNDVCVNISKAEGNPKNGDYVPYTTKAIPFYSYSYTKDNAGDDVWVGLSMYIRGYPYTERWGRPCFVFRSSFNGAYSYYTETVSPTDYDRIYDWIVFNYKGDSIFGEPNGPKGGDDFAELIDEPIPEPILPTVTAVNTGLTKLYWIAGGNKSKISDLMDWFNDPDLQFVNHLFKGDPIEALVGINLSPLPLTAVGTPNMHFLGIDTGIAADGAIADQYQEIDCGEIPIEMWEKDTYLDFSPHTRIKAVLPYIGIIDLNPDDIKGKKLGLKYIIDALTGSCVAHLTVNGNLRYEASGNCFINIPITNKDYSAAISAEKGAIASVADTLMSTGGLMAMGTGATPAGAIAMVGGSMVSNAINVATAHPSIRYIGGNTGATSGYMGFDRPFIMIEQPAQARPENDQHYFGMPSYMTDLIGSFSGFNKFNNFHIENIDCTEIERADIDNNLKNGVIIQNGSGTPNTTPVTTGNFVIVLLHNQSDSNTIGKIFKSGEGQRLKVEGKLLNNQSILNPSFVIETNDVYTYNYAYIPLLHRYYYIEDIIALSNNMIQLNMQSDALQSFKDQIKACKGICARAEKDDHVNYYIDDGAITVEQRMEIKTLQFKKNGERFNFTRSSAGFVLVVAAGD